MNAHTLLEKLKKLELPLEDFVVVGSGTLTIKGIRDSKDIDIIVTFALWEELSKKYEIKVNSWGVETLAIGEDVEILNPKDSIFGNSKIIPMEEIMSAAEVVDGIKFMNLKHLRKIKEHLGREKDLKDIELIDKYINGNIV